jgi:hypothetical protein
MSVEITNAFVKQYQGNAIHRVQQKGTKLRGLVREEGMVGKVKFFERIGLTTARKRTSRHSDTPRMDVPHDRRAAFIDDYDWADLVDDEDKVRLLIDPASEYLIAGTNAMLRAMDDVIIEAATAENAYGADGEGAITAVAMPAVQKVVVNAVAPGDTPANSNLTIEKLRQASAIFGEHDLDPDMEYVMVVAQKQLTALLRTTEVTDADYNSVRTLVDGKVDSFMGFRFVRSQRLPKDASGHRRCFAFVTGFEGGMGLAVPRQLKARISERADKNYATQVFLSMTLGAARIEDEKVVWVACDESA